MATGKPRIYWDTAPLIAWIKDEKRKDRAEMDGLAEVVDLVDRGKVILMTSVLWRAEVLDSSLSQLQRRKISEIFESRTIVELAIDGRVMQLTSEIRSFHHAAKSKGKLQNIKVPDAIHLASAIHYGAEEFHTFDGARDGGAKGGLLTLDGNVAGHRLRICTPRAKQLTLLLAAADDEDANDGVAD